VTDSTPLRGTAVRCHAIGSFQGMKGRLIDIIGNRWKVKMDGCVILKPRTHFTVEPDQNDHTTNTTDANQSQHRTDRQGDNG